MRVFDVLACGGFLLAEYSKGLEDLFILDEELVCYRTMDELIQKVDYYTKNPHLTKQIAERGRERVLRDHTIAARVHAMLAQVRAARLQSPSLILVG